MGEELESLAVATRLCMWSLNTTAPRSMLLAFTLRAPESRLTGGEAADGGAANVAPLVTQPAALEWVDGPAADPLQLSLCLVLGSDDTAECDLELVSGAWSEW